MAATAVTRPEVPDGSPDARAAAPTGGSRTPPLWIVLTAVALGVVLRLWTTSPMWLDEALTVNIAGLGLGELRAALERDGAPPVYYALLAVWIDVVGDGDVAARLLSAVFSVAALPLVYVMGRRRGGRAVGMASVVLLATSPFAIRYATEARMYSLVALLVAAGWVCLANALERDRARTAPWLAGSGAFAGLLLLTHYWGFYLVAATIGALAVIARRDPRRRTRALQAAAAVGTGCAVIFAPWVPTFVSQLRHTGTPWGTAPGPVEVAFTTLVDFGGGPFPEGQALAALLAALALLALFGRPVDRWRIELDIRTIAGVRADFAVAVAALLAGVAVGFATQSAWASRYTSIALPLVIVVAAFGVRAFDDRRVIAAVLATAAVLGLAGGVRNAVTHRTQAEEVASVIEGAGGTAGDLVVYCPDQLAPDVHRVLPSGYDHYTFPELGDPRFVDWVDYADRMGTADPAAFAAAVLDRAQGRDIFYVWMPGYRSLDKKCERVNDAFGGARPANRQLLDPDTDYFERHAVWLHRAP